MEVKAMGTGSLFTLQVWAQPVRSVEDWEQLQRHGRSQQTHWKVIAALPAVDEAIARVEQRILALGEREVKSRVIGEMVMRELKKMDDVAYIRFASVYEDFQRVDDFRDVIAQVRKPGAKRTR
jgi:transcriptional regulator NrdR family protein